MSTPLQLAYNSWNRRASQFRANNIPTSAYQQLYQRDIQTVASGGTAMTDADVYAGVQSAVHGPQIQDPTAQHGGHGFFSGVLDVLGNIPRDVGGIITGFPEGIAHTVAHFPSEVTNTGALLEHLMTDDNAWLQQKGYLQKGDTLHGGWSGFATILQALNNNGSKQLMPFIPGLSDLADMTSAQGRNLLMQHPVGSLLNVLPEAGWLGKLATVGRDFGDAAELAGIGNKGVANEPRFWAAGRALQKGNPVKALVSATGDILPGGFDDASLSKITARQRVNMTATAMGFSRAIRESIIRPYMDKFGSGGELQTRVRRFQQQVFGDKIWDQMTPERALYLYQGFHLLVNPDTGQTFRTMDEFNQWRDTLDPQENAAFTKATDLGEYTRKSMEKAGYVGRVPYLEQLAGGQMWDGMGGMTVSTRSRVWKAWETVQRHEEKFNDAIDDKYDLSKTKEEQEAAHKSAVKYGRLLNESKQELARKQAVEFPGEWNNAIVAHIRAGAKSDLSQYMDAQQLSDVLADLDKSVYENDFKRVMGDKNYARLKNDAIRWWWEMGRQGMTPIYFHDVNPEHIDRILSPGATVEKIGVPPQLTRRELGLNFGDTVFDVRVGLTRDHMEMLRAAFVEEFINTHILPLSYKKADKLAEYQDAIARLKDSGKPIPKSAQALVKENFKDFNPHDFGVRNVKFKNVEGAEYLIDNETHKFMKQLAEPWDYRGPGHKTLVKGHSIFKFSVLAGPRHLVHVGFGGMAMMLGGEPQAVLKLGKAYQVMRAANRGEPLTGIPPRTIPGSPPVLESGLSGLTLSGLREEYYQLGRPHTWDGQGVNPIQAWSYQSAKNAGEYYLTDLIHQAKKVGVSAAQYIPNELSRLETNIMTMYKTAVYLSKKDRGGSHAEALEAAHKLFVDMNGMSIMERNIVKNFFPFYAFTRHLFRYLGQYPVDYPIRAAIMTNFAEQQQADWQSGLPRSMMSLYFLGHTDSKGNILAFDLKNVNPFRSFANDFSLAGFTSSLSPFITAPLNYMGVDTLSGTTQLYPGTSFNPQTGSLQATPSPGWEWSAAEAFVPQFGLLDHFFKLTSSTRLLAKYNPTSYGKQIYNMLNIPFVPEVVNVPYEKEITEMRRFRAAQSAVSLVEKDPSSTNISKLLTWNAVPFDNQLISPQALATYYARVQAALTAAGQQVSPKAVLKKPPTRKATLSSELAPVS